ncbi:MAG: hypothetical protein HY336_02890 [Candidatus Doudnabacteria bacterium]|nr:hypothetical protein [Candidatus Doudnabacteria bacterium]
MSSYSKHYGSSLAAFIGGIIAWAVFGDKIKARLNRSKAWHELKQEVKEEVAKAKNLTRETYNRIVDAAADKYSVARGISKNELKDLVEDLKMHWARIRDAWNKEGGDIE